jgi:hypothetical protein
MACSDSMCATWPPYGVSAKMELGAQRSRGTASASQSGSSAAVRDKNGIAMFSMLRADDASV